jgi:type I restriction enzyme S subunit
VGPRSFTKRPSRVAPCEPRELPRKRIADLSLRVTVGFVGSQSKLFVDEGVALLRGQNIKPYSLDLTNLKYISAEVHERWRKSALQPGDVAIVRVGYPGTACVIPPGLGPLNAASLVIVRPDIAALDPHYLAYVLNSPWGKATLAGSLVGSAQQVLNTATVASLEIPAPPLATQRRIAAILSAYDDLMENNNRRIKILEEMAQRIYREWFVDFRYPGHEDGPLTDSQLGPIPEAWEISDFADLGVYVNGFAFKPTDWGSEGPPIIKIRELKSGVTNETPRYAGELPAKYIVRDGDLLFSWSADLDAYLWTGGTAWLNQHLFRVDPVADIPTTFLFHALKEHMREFRSLSQGTTMRHIKRMALSQVMSVLPPPALRSQFAECVEPIDALALALVRTNRNARKTRDLLLPRLVSGEIDVADLDIAVSLAA